MEIWKILLIVLLSTVLLGCIIGVLVGKHQLKRQSGNYKPLLSRKERIVYSACVLLGAACITFGVLYTKNAAPPAGEEAMLGMDGEMVGMDGAYMEEGVPGAEMNPDLLDEGAALSSGETAEPDSEGTATEGVPGDEAGLGTPEGEEPGEAAGESPEANDEMQANPGTPDDDEAAVSVG